MNADLPHSLTPHAAWKMLNSNPQAILVDIRSSMEFLFVGHPQGAIHVAWIDEPDWTINPNFVTEIRQLILGGVSSAEGVSSTPIILICRSGKRSLDAGQALLRDGLRMVYHIDEGFEGERDEQHHRSSVGGWRFHGLPWEQC
jgi:rhodanese-related sulfurtransferase